MVRFSRTGERSSNAVLFFCALFFVARPTGTGLRNGVELRFTVRPVGIVQRDRRDAGFTLSSNEEGMVQRQSVWKPGPTFEVGHQEVMSSAVLSLPSGPGDQTMTGCLIGSLRPVHDGALI